MAKVVIITGVCGSGKTTALYTFEEAGYYVVDNIPLTVAEPFFDTISKNKKYENVALSVPLEIALQTYEIAKNYKDFDLYFVGVTSSRESLNERYRLSRKRHPLQSKGLTLDKAIQKDYNSFEAVRESFTNVFDTSKLDQKEFEKLIYNTVLGESAKKFSVMFMSFGYKKSVPQDIETVFDVRLLPNPYWVAELRELTGLDEPVKDYVLNAPETRSYLAHVTNYLNYYLEELKKSGKRHASIGIACSGGQHRSVAIAQYLADFYSKKYRTSVFHRDVNKK